MSAGKRQPKRIGRYEIHATLGRGGMSAVYRASRVGPGHATKQVALKLIHHHLTQSRHLVQMFLDEMRVTMAMSHRNIVQTFDADEAEEAYYMVMELVEGCSLRKLMATVNGPLPVDITLFVGVEVSAALDYAHGLQPDGVVHRDISPGNILLSYQGDVKLTDFGIAKAANRLNTTMMGAFKGKLGYIAPEQAQGQAAAGSDIFSLGAVLYEMLADRPLRSTLTLDEARLPPRLSAPVSAHNPAVPAALDTVIADCLAPTPARRPTALELGQRLSDVLDGLARPDGQDPSRHRRLQRFLAQEMRPSAATDAAARLERAVMAQVAQLPTDPGVEPPRAGLEQTVTPLFIDQVTARPVSSTDTVLPPPRSRFRWLHAVAALVLLAGAGAALLYLWPARPPSAVSVVRRPDGTVSAPTPATQPVAAASRPTPASRPAPPVPDAAPPRRVLRRQGRRPRIRAGFLDLNTEPWTVVFVDGKSHGQTPIQGLSLAPGVHRVRLVNTKEGISRALKIRIRPGRTLRKVLVLQ
jgi:serine/threonine protein kinase